MNKLQILALPFSFQDLLILADMSYSTLVNLVSLVRTGVVAQPMTRRNSRHLVAWIRTLGIVSTLSETPISVPSPGDSNQEARGQEAGVNGGGEKLFVIEDPVERAAAEAEQKVCQLCNKTFHSGLLNDTDYWAHKYQ